MQEEALLGRLAEAGDEDARPWRIGLLLAGPHADDEEACAIDFCRRGRTVDLVPIPAGEHAPAALDATLDLTGSGRGSVHGVPALLVTDGTGAALTESMAVATAIRRGTGMVDVNIRDGLGSVLARGFVSTRRTTEHTRLHMLRVAGPLLVMAARAFPLPATRPLPPIAAEIAAPRQRRSANAMGMVRFVGRSATRMTTALQWRVARVPGDEPLTDLVVQQHRPPTALMWHAAAKPDFWADPFVHPGDPDLLFVEELDMSTGRGVIRVLEVVGDDVQPRAIVLQTEHHLSFPQIYRTSHGWLGTVETCAEHNPIYTFDEPGAPWRPTELPALPPHVGDPVLVIANGGDIIGLLGTDAQTDADSVVVRYRLDAPGQRWLRLDESVRVSVVNGRGGGTFDLARGWRATQDCAGAYGRAVEVMGILGGGPPQTLARIDADTLGPGQCGRRPRGVHTLSWTPDGSQVWCDSWVRRPTPLGWLWDMRERSHLKSCHG